MHSHEQTSPDSQRATILVVDDDPAVLSSLGFLFEIEGFTVQLYPNGAALLMETAIPAVGCLVVDYRLPDISGLELISILRARRVAIPAVLITTSPTPAILAEAAQSSVSVIEKPLLTGALFEQVRRVLSLPS
ncbi:MAG: response regulator transcription factor [Pseudomonadota bacterium]